MSELIKRQDAIDAVAKAYRYESDRMTALQEVPIVTEQEIRNKAIDEFAERMKQGDVIEYMGSYVSYEATVKFIDELAEQMKGGAEWVD